MTPRDNASLSTSEKLNLAAGGAATVLVLAELAQGDYTMAFLASVSAALTAGSTVSRLGAQKSKEVLATAGSAAVSTAVSFGNNCYNLGYMGWTLGSSYFNSGAKAKIAAAKKTDVELTPVNEMPALR